ncbi:kinetochore complex Sim4 subunit Fta1-domain-containing protein [Spinellus fusiger]|nr:kinetochore complex Sim4 subunit Fta1-domain-containing protein [Spinellus fusiger]
MRLARVTHCLYYYYYCCHYYCNRVRCLCVCFMSAHENDLARIVNKTFALYRCSPLFDFGAGLKKTTRREHALRRHLAAQLHFDPGDAPSMETANRNRDGVPYKGIVLSTRFQPLVFPDWPSGAEPIEITIEVSSYSKNMLPMHHIILLPSLRSGLDLPDGIASYPLILVKSASGVGEIVVHWLEKSMDCVIRPFQIPDHSLNGFVETWACSLLDAPSEDDPPIRLFNSRPSAFQALELVYHFPSKGNINTVAISIHMEELSKMLTEARVQRIPLMEAIKSHLMTHMRLQVESLTLGRMGTPVVYLTNEGKLKFIPNGSKHRILQITKDLIQLAENQ